MSNEIKKEVKKTLVESTKEKLDKAPHVDFIIPANENESPNIPESVQINGYRVEIKKGVMVNIPVPVANILAEKYKISMEVGKNKKIDRSQDVADALS